MKGVLNSVKPPYIVKKVKESKTDRNFFRHTTFVVIVPQTMRERTVI